MSFASTLGATLAMLVSRYLLRDWVQRRFAAQMSTIDREWIATARATFCPAPDAVVPVLSGQFADGANPSQGVSLLVGQPACNATCHRHLSERRTRAGKLTSLRDILSPGLLFAFTLLGLLPLVTRWLFSRYIPSIKK